MLKNKKGVDTLKLVFSLVLSLIVVSLLVYLIPKYILPSIGDIASCQLKQGHCYGGKSCSEIGRDFLATKTSDCKDDQICCSGEPVEYGQGGTSSGSGGSAQSVCPTDEICYTRKTSDGTKIYTSLDFWNPSASNNKNCMWVENVPRKNNLPKADLIFSTTINNAACCKLQLAGIDVKTADNKFPYFNTGSVETVNGVVINDTCTANLNFNFISPKSSVFKVNVWNNSYDNYMGGNCLDQAKQKPMFKLDLVYWEDENNCGDSGKSLSSSVLLHVPALEPANAAANGGTSGGQTGSGGSTGSTTSPPHTIKLLFDDRKFMFNELYDACEFMCEARSDDSVSACDFAALMYVNSDEECPTNVNDYKVTGGNSGDYIKVFLDNGELQRNGYINNRPDKKLCFIGGKDNVYSAPDNILPYACDRLYYVDTFEKISPTNVCDDFYCSAIGESQGTCNFLNSHIWPEQLLTNYPSLEYYNRNSFCADKNCYFGEDPDVWSMFTSDNCKDCIEMGVDSCSDYNLQQACGLDPCRVSTLLYCPPVKV